MKKYLINSAAIIMAISSITGFFTHIFASPNEINHFAQYLVDIVTLFLSWQLYNRRRKAWVIYLIALGIDVIAYIFFFQSAGAGYYLGALDYIYCGVDIFVLAVLIFCQKSFKWKTQKLTSSGALIPLGIMMFDFGFAYFINRDAEYPFDVLFEIFLGDDFSRIAVVMCFIFWVSLIITVYLAFRPRIFAATRSKSLKSYARYLVKKYGQNPTSYLTLEHDKLLFFGNEIEGVVAYGILGNVVVALGDPICADEDFARLLAEFKGFCAKNDYQCIFLGTTDKYLDIYEMFGYNRVKCGEEARFELSEYHLAGGRMAKLRAQINHANKAGLTTHEYKPGEQRSSEIEQGFQDVSNEWLRGKKSGLLGFTVGKVGLEDPLDRRYFYARDPNGKIVAFNVFTPFLCMDGYMADVTRRTDDAPGGATEKLTYDAFMQFREEGIHWGSMGLATLSNVRDEGIEDSLTVRMLEFVYEKCNGFYGFKDLYKAKERYSPTFWESSYFVYSGKALTPPMIYAVVSIQNSGGVKDFVSGFVHGLRDKQLEKAVKAREAENAALQAQTAK